MPGNEQMSILLYSVALNVMGEALFTTLLHLKYIYRDTQFIDLKLTISTLFPICRVQPTNGQLCSNVST